MFVHGTIEVACPFDTVAARLRTPGWIRPAAAAALQEVTSPNAHNGDGAAGGVQIGQPRQRTDSILLPVFWEAHASPEVILVFEGDIEISARREGVTTLHFTASYPPPPARAHDPDVRDLAARTVDELLAAVADALTAEAPP